MLSFLTPSFKKFMEGPSDMLPSSSAESYPNTNGMIVEEVALPQAEWERLFNESVAAMPQIDKVALKGIAHMTSRAADLAVAAGNN